MKRIESLILALLMMLTLISVQAENEKDPVTIVYVFAGNGMQTDTALVNEALNEWLHKTPGYEYLSIELIPCGGSGNSLATQITLLEASNEQIDMCNSYGITMGDYVNDGYAIPLNDLIDETTLNEELPQWLLNLGKWGDTMYFVPNLQQPTKIRYLVVPTEYLQYYDGGAEAIRDVWLNPESTTEDKLATIEDFVFAVREGTGLQTKWSSSNLYPQEFLPMEGFLSYWIVNRIGTDEIVNVFEQDCYVDALRTQARWYSEGIIHPDSATITLNDYIDANSMNDESIICWFNNGFFLDADHLTDVFERNVGGVDLSYIPTQSQYAIGSTWSAGGNWITSSCQHPEDAMKIIELLNSEKGTEFYNLLVYGIEGRQYTVNEDGSIHTLEYDGKQGGSSVSYMTPGWEVGNVIHQYHNQSYVEGQNEMIMDVANSDKVLTSTISGVKFDTTKVADQWAQVTSVYNEYFSILGYGIEGIEQFDTYYNEMIDKLYSAGLQDVLDEMNAQIEAAVK